MSAAASQPDTEVLDAGREAYETLDAQFPGALALLLTPLCEAGRAHTHPEFDEEAKAWKDKPCKNRGKRPTGKDWNPRAIARFESGEGREAHLKGMATYFGEQRNVGLVIPPGVLVLDADDAVSVSYLKKNLPIAPRQRTHSGAHFFVKAPADIKLRAKTKVHIATDKGKQILADLRVAGVSQVVVQPSVHEQGTRYEFVIPLREDLHELPECPDRIARMIEKDLQGKNKNTASGAAEGDLFSEGSRNDSLFRVGCQLRGAGFDGAEIWAAVEALNESRCSPPLDVGEVHSIANSVLRYERGSFRSAPPAGESVSETSDRNWSFFLGGDADGSAEHRSIIDDLIHEAVMAMIYGPQGTLKTQLVIDMVAHAALGKPFQGRHTTTTRALYIAAEGAGAIGKRIAAVDSEHPGLPKDWLIAIPQAVSLMNAKEATDFAAFIVREILPMLTAKLGMIVFDTMAKSIAGESDSDDKTISQMEANARLIANHIAANTEDGFTPACLVVHHPRKNDGAYRGSGAIEGNFDTIMSVTRTDAQALEDRLFEVSLEKVKDGPIENGWAYRAALVHVGTTPSGKENFAPVVRYIDAAEHAAHNAAASVNGRRVTRGQKNFIELIARIEIRDGRQWVPAKSLEESGFLAQRETLDGTADCGISGVTEANLKEMFMSTLDDSPDGQRTVSDVREANRKKWERARNSSVSAGLVWAFDGWLWLPPAAARTEADG